MDSIGKNNPKLVAIRNAIRKGALTSDGLLPIEGRKLIQDAAASGLEVSDVFVREGEDAGGLSAQRVHLVNNAVFKSIQSTETSQGFIALVRPRTCSLEDILRRDRALVVVLARLQDPGNVGTILRVAESFGASGCIGLAGTASPYNPKAVRASTGSVLRLPHIWNVPPHAGLKALREHGIRIIATAPHGKNSPESCDWSASCALVIGNEGGGLDPEELSACDDVVSIAQNPEVESLNSAIAAAIILYEASKQRRQS